MTAPAVGLARTAATISAWNAVSRLTGFVRVLAVAAALGATFVGNTYQSSNLVSNVLFEILAAGLLSAPLVPAFVRLVDGGRRADAERLAGALLALALVALGAVVVVGMAAAGWVMRLLTLGVDDPAVRQAEIRLGTFFLWFFLPQVLLYAVGAVASALLHAARRFSAAAFAPVANNVLVTATMVAFMALSGAERPGLALSTGEKLVLAVGTTGGVLAMSAVPVVALARAGFRLRPRWAGADQHVREVLRVGAWGAVLLASAQVLIAVTLVLANRVEGGVVAYTVAYTFFLLPHAVVAHPVYTALYPRLAAHVHAGDRAAFRADVQAAVRRLVVWLALGTLALVAVAAPLLGVVEVGALDDAGAALVRRVLAAYAFGVVGYGVFQLLARAATAAGHARLPAVVGAAMTVAGAALMVAGSAAAEGGDRVVVLGVAHSVVATAGAVGLGLALRRRA